MNLPEVVSREEWVVARKRLLAQEKEFTRARDRLNAERRRLPMVRIDKEYVLLNGTFNYLDLTALGRQEPWEEPFGRSWPPASGWWWRRHDEYEHRTNDSGDAMSKERAHPSQASMVAPWPLDAWPNVPTRFVLCSEDRFFPPAFFRPLVAERLGIVPDEIASGHCVALSRPKGLADLLDSSR